MALLNKSAGYNARNAAQAKVILKASVAWRIEENKGKFVTQPTENLGCPLGGIDTVDGGP